LRYADHCAIPATMIRTTPVIVLRILAVVLAWALTSTA
jgi:hypothetical protein